MPRYAVAVLCFATLLTCSSFGQKINPEPVHIAAGTVLAFHLQTRLQATGENETDLLPKGTVIMVKMLDSIDSSVDHDGAEFRGSVVTSIVSGNEVVVHAESEVRGLFVLLRSRTHPEGFRYELLVTHIRDHDRSLDLTASLSTSFSDGSAQPAAVPESGKIESPRENASPNQN